LKKLLRQLPQINFLLETEPAAALIARFSRAEVVEALRAQLHAVRAAVLASHGETAFCASDFFAAVAEVVEAGRQPSLRPVINATGILIHTNLGRAPLAPEALLAIQGAGAGYSNLELDLERGARGSRQDHLAALICRLTGAEAAMVVNNGAAAVMLSLGALARNRDVIASRGELIEIGGAFRLPDVIAESGARLREVGATNKTRLADYERAVTSETAILLKSHTSNYRIVGFTAAPARRDLSALARAHGLVFMEDLGSGVLVDLSPHGLPDEPIVSRVLSEGVDLVTFSGDKLLGGPQAGILAGAKSLIDRLKSNPLARAVRIDKLSLAALEATLRLYLPPHNPMAAIPVLAAIAQMPATVDARARALAEALDPSQAEVIGTVAQVGGGSLPQQGLASFAVALSSRTQSAETLAAHLRYGRPAVVGRIKDDRLLLDMRAVRDTDLPDLIRAVRQALKE
jgi:L-seryl-tRNA(Ser) seleniumtransferase